MNFFDRVTPTGPVWRNAAALLLSVTALSASAQTPTAAPALEALTLRAAETLFLERNRELLAARRALEGARSEEHTSELQ